MNDLFSAVTIPVSQEDQVSYFTDTRLLRSTLAAFLFALILASPALAQDEPEDDRSNLVNYVYASMFGSGLYVVAGRSINVYRIPISTQLRSIDDHPYGLRVQIPVTLGFYEFEVGDLLEGEFPDDLHTVTLMPGVEWELPVAKRWTLKPIGSAGAGKDMQGGEVVWIYSAALRTYFTWERSLASKLTVGNRLLYVGNITEDSRSDGMGTVETGIDYQFGVGSIGHRRASLSAYGLYNLYLDPVEFVREEGPPVVLDAEYEVGMTFGVEPEWSWWKISAPRIGLGYRFATSNDLASIRITFGLPF